MPFPRVDIRMGGRCAEDAGRERECSSRGARSYHGDWLARACHVVRELGHEKASVAIRAEPRCRGPPTKGHRLVLSFHLRVCPMIWMGCVVLLPSFLWRGRRRVLVVEKSIRLRGPCAGVPGCLA